MVPDPMQSVQLNEADTNKTEKLISGLRSEFGGPQFEPHVTVVGVVRLTEEETRDKFRRGSEGVKKVYSVNVEKVDNGTFFYQCVYLLLHPTNE
ncbi:hypothetical protein H5410_057328, partial [Solanum commersonii]